MRWPGSSYISLGCRPPKLLRVQKWKGVAGPSAASPGTHRHMAAQVSDILLGFWPEFLADMYGSTGPLPGTARRQVYAGVLSRLQALMLSRTAELEKARPC